jgi:hypothetical protein
MTGSKCDSCSAPLNFALSCCAYCGSPIQQKFGTAFPVRCPWNGTKTCGDCKGYDVAGLGRHVTPYHCAHCHAAEPHPMSPHGVLLHSAVRIVDGKTEAVCPTCLKLDHLEGLHPSKEYPFDWSTVQTRMEQYIEGDRSPFYYPPYWPFSEPLCEVCRAEQKPIADRLEADSKAEYDKYVEQFVLAAPQEKPKNPVRSAGDEMTGGWFAKRRAAKKEAES